MQKVGEFVVAADHPSLPGHFPGRPIVPGVVLIDAALSVVMATLPPARLAGIASAKFSAVVLPGQTITVRCDAPATIPGRIAFQCEADETVVVSGSAMLEKPGA